MNDSTCRWPECERPARTRDYCQRDYYRAKTEGNFIDPWSTWVDKTHATRTGRKPSGGTCAWPKCGATAKQSAMCSLHYGRGYRMGNLIDPWLTWQKHPRCVTCGNAFEATRSTHRYCSSRCNMTGWIDVNSDRYRELSLRGAHKRRARMAAAPHEHFTSSDVRERAGDDCYLCGEPIDFDLRYPDPMSPSLDHITPISRGGGHILANAAMTHLVCNIRKGARAPKRHPFASSPI